MPCSHEIIARRREKRFQELVEYKNRHGDCNVPLRYAQNTALGGWVSKVRNNRQGMSQDQRKRLDELGFDWETREEYFERIWNGYFERLETYRSEYADCDVPRFFEDDPDLGRWVSEQRRLYNKCRLPPHRHKRLESIQFCWGKYHYSSRDLTEVDRKWMEYYARLVHFHAKHGHCLVPTTYQEKEEKSLGTWVCKQRLAYSNNDLPEHRKQLLDEIGFIYRIELVDASIISCQRRWDRKYHKLVQYKKEHGHVNISHAIRGLKTWFQHQRALCRRGRLLPGREQKLTALLRPGWAKIRKKSHKSAFDVQLSDRDMCQRDQDLNGDELGPGVSIRAPGSAQASVETVRSTTSKEKNNSQSRRLSNDSEASADRTQMHHPIGTRVKKYFQGYGWFSGSVIGFDEDLGYYDIRYEDGDEEELQLEELEKVLVDTEEAVTNIESEQRHIEDSDQKENDNGSVIYRNKRRKGQSATGPHSKRPKKTAVGRLLMRYPLGTRVRKHFPGYGWFEGTVVSFDAQLGLYDVHYEDGDEEEFNQEELKEFLVIDDNQDERAMQVRQENVDQSKPSADISGASVESSDDEVEWDGSL